MFLIKQKEWAFKQKTAAIQFVSNLAKQSQYYPMEDILFYPYAFDKYDDDLVK